MREILKKKNIIMNQKPDKKESIIRYLGNLLYEQGYVEEAYIQGMLDKEAVFNTNIGNAIAIPHGIEEVKKYVKESGIAIMVVPEGTDWGNQEKVKMIIAIAGAGDEHLDILGRIAEVLSNPADVQRLINSTSDEIYELFH